MVYAWWCHSRYTQYSKGREVAAIVGDCVWTVWLQAKRASGGRGVFTVIGDTILYRTWRNMVFFLVYFWFLISMLSAHLFRSDKDYFYCCLNIHFWFIPKLLRDCDFIKLIAYYVVMNMIYNRDGSRRANLNLIFEIEVFVPQWSTLPNFLKNDPWKCLWSKFSYNFYSSFGWIRGLQLIDGLGRVFGRLVSRSQPESKWVHNINSERFDVRPFFWAVKRIGTAQRDRKEKTCVLFDDGFNCLLVDCTYSGSSGWMNACGVLVEWYWQDNM